MACESKLAIFLEAREIFNAIFLIVFQMLKKTLIETNVTELEVEEAYSETSCIWQTTSNFAFLRKIFPM